VSNDPTNSVITLKELSDQSISHLIYQPEYHVYHRHDTVYLSTYRYTIS